MPTTTETVHPVDERLPLPRLVPLALQHVLVMCAGAVAVPLIIGRAPPPAGGHRLPDQRRPFTFLKSTGSGWADFAKGPYTTIPKRATGYARRAWRPAGVGGPRPRTTRRQTPRSWTPCWRCSPPHTATACRTDSLYRMATAALGAVPKIDEVGLACPNKHHLPIDLSRFGPANEDQVFLPTDEPHGQIECTVVRE